MEKVLVQYMLVTSHTLNHCQNTVRYNKDAWLQTVAYEGT